MCLFSTTLNWLTASQSLLAGSSKSITRACAPRMLAVGVAVLDRHAVHQQAVQRAVAHDQVGAFGPRQLAEGVVQRLGRQRRVEPRERIAQALREHHLPVVVALGRGFAGGDLGAVADLPAGAFEPGERGLLDDGFGEGGHPDTPVGESPK